jgi:outer membrane protein assembly factor BamD
MTVLSYTAGGQAFKSLFRLAPPRTRRYSDRRMHGRSRWPVGRTLALGLALVLAGGAVGCAHPKPAENPLHYAEDAERAYKQALDAFFDRDWENATTLFQALKQKYAYSRYARLAELRLADIAYHQEKFAEAVTDYKSFVHDYPNDPEVPYARYRVAKSLFHDASGSFLLPPLEERDLVNVREAYSTIQGFLADYPTYKHAAEMHYMLEVVTGLLARHELYVAHFYLRIDDFKAAAARIQYALRNYHDSGLEPEALTLLGETYMKMHKKDEARAVFLQLLSTYPASPFTVPAKNFLKRLGVTAPKVLHAPLQAAPQPAASSGRTMDARAE